METAPTAQVVSDPVPDAGPMPDEQLATLVRESGLKSARDELLARTARQRTNLLRRLVRDAGLSEADRSDVQQEAVLWTLEAIQNYDRGSAAPGGCSFRSFLHRVITCRFIDFLRHRLRYHRHFVLVGATLPPHLDGRSRYGGTGLTHATVRPDESEQHQELEGRESNDLLRRQLDRLGVRTRKLWEMMARGASVLEISVDLHISYDSAKRRRHKLLLRLRRSLATGGGDRHDTGPARCRRNPGKQPA